MILDGRAPQSIEACVSILEAGGLVAFPTETVYGLGADAASDTAVAAIFAAKGRPTGHPVIVHVDDDQQGAAGVAHFAAQVPEPATRLMRSFWPGPLTLILPRRAAVGSAAAGGQASIGLRCPRHPVAQALLRACRARGIMGLAAPSANHFGRVSPTTAAHVREEFGDQLAILDGGPCDVGLESTIVDCTRSVPVLLRPGAITATQLASACGSQVLAAGEAAALRGAAPRASGTLVAHYAPKARVRLMDARALQSALDLLGTDIDRGTGVIAVYARAPLRSRARAVLLQRMPDDAALAGRELFATLRSFDAQGASLIWVEDPPATPAWEAVRDRLQRASAAG